MKDIRSLGQSRVCGLPDLCSSKPRSWMPPVVPRMLRDISASTGRRHRMDTIALKHSPGHYRKRFNRFLWLLISVRGMAPRNRHLWQIMDGVAFQDTETALEVALTNEGKALDADQAERLTVALKTARRLPRKAANQ